MNESNMNSSPTHKTHVINSSNSSNSEDQDKYFSPSKKNSDAKQITLHKENYDSSSNSNKNNLSKKHLRLSSVWHDNFNFANSFISGSQKNYSPSPSS